MKKGKNRPDKIQFDTTWLLTLPTKIIMPKLSNLELTLDQKVNIAKMIKIIDCSANVKPTRKQRRAKQISKETLDEELDQYWRGQKKRQTDVNSLD